MSERFWVTTTTGYLTATSGSAKREAPGVTAMVLDRYHQDQVVAQYRSEDMPLKTPRGRREMAVMTAQVHAAGLNGGKVGKPPPKHGTPYRYRLGCRCPWCRQANTDQCRVLRARMRDRGWKEKRGGAA